MSREDPRTDVEQWFDRMSKQLEEASRWWEGTGKSWRPIEESANVDVIDRGGEYVVTMDLPGYTTDAVTATLTDHTLFVEAEREGVDETETDGTEEYLRMERSHESISRRVRLPEAVDAENVSARMNNGVLTITVPKMGGASSGTSIDIE